MTAFTKESAVGTEMVGKLYRSDSGWILLKVPNALVRGIFATIDEPGIELPPKDSEDDSRLNAHISVMRPEEVATIPGGANAITERGRDFRYRIGKMESFNPRGWAAMSKCWVLNVKSPELEKFRKSYGLTAIPNDGKYPFHITVAVRRKKVLQENEIAKAPHAALLQDGTGDRAGGVGDRQPDSPHGSTVATEYTGAPAAGKSYLGSLGRKEVAAAATEQAGEATPLRISGLAKWASLVSSRNRDRGGSAPGNVSNGTVARPTALSVASAWLDKSAFVASEPYATDDTKPVHGTRYYVPDDVHGGFKGEAVVVPEAGHQALYDVYTKPEHRGKGVMREIMDEVIAQHGHEPMSLRPGPHERTFFGVEEPTGEAFDKGIEALKELYKDFGFQEAAREFPELSSQWLQPEELSKYPLMLREPETADV